MTTITNNNNNIQRCINFGAGPAKMPLEVLREVQGELLSYRGCGMSVMELSHRSKEYCKINQDAQDAIRELLKLPDNYKVLFLQGGGTGCFAAVPLNLMGRTGKADYVVTGIWSGKAAKEAAKYGKINLVFPKPTKVGAIPDVSTWKLDPEASYFYYCHNETVDGVTIRNIPDTKGVPIVADMSSSLMTQEVDVSKFGVIFAGAQKNLGPAGVTIVIIREDLLGNSLPITPSVLDFAQINEMNSILNTPPAFCVYTLEKVMQWIKRSGGLPQMEKLAIAKSQLLYRTIENSKGFYSCPIPNELRSRINIPFRVGGPGGDENIEKIFLDGAEKLQMKQLKGHRLVGGMRASLYNAVTLEEVQVLVNYMIEFQKQYSKN